MEGNGRLSLDNLCPPLVAVPIEHWNRISQRALRFALSISHTVLAVHVKMDGGPPHLVVLVSPYRFIVRPILEYVLELERRHSDRQLAVIVPDLVEHRWYERFLHNQRGELLTALLLLKGNKRISIVNVPWYLKGQ